MGSSDPLSVGFEIRFGSLNFQATGNGYLMRLTNREELRARHQAGSVPVAATRVAATPAPASTDAAGPSVPRRRRHSSQRSRQARSERRHAARVASQRDALPGETTATPAGERTVSGPRFPIGLHGATTAYVVSANANATMRRVPPDCHVLVARDPSASAGDESSQGSADELPPATSHGYAEWDFSGVLDPMMFRRFLDATDYWFGYSDNSSAGSYDPTRECCVVIANDPTNAADAAGADDGEVPPALGTGPRMAAGPSAPPPSPPRGDRHQRTAGPRTRARGQAGRRIPHGAVASRIHRGRSLRARRTRARVGQASPRPHQRRLQRRRSKHAPASEPEARCYRNAAVGHDCPLDARGTKLVPRGAGTHRTSGRPTGRKLNVSHPPARKCAGRRGAGGPEPSVHMGGAAGRPANPERTPAKERLLDTRGQA
jgi:hypothetical protein